MPLTFELPEKLSSEAKSAAEAAGETVEAFIARAVAFEIERERTDKFFAERRARANIGRALEILDREGGEPPQPGDELPEGYVRTR
ncbi:MAG TPA: toxin-antitoxin system HicB family antitoxin [Hyphomonadaceae bacterium]|nr:toxin-antitoxin system HicB family antitoxin [Hyphomonadaceae bacterium]